MDHSADVAAMAIVVEQEEEEEAANRRRRDSPPPYQQAVVDEEEQELDVTVYPQLWDQLDRLEEHCQTFDEASCSTRFWKMCLYGLNIMGSKSPSYSDNLKRACFAGWVLLKDSIFPLVGNKLAVLLWTVGHFVCASSILFSASIEEVAAASWFYTVSVVFASIAFLLASADLLCTAVGIIFKCDISEGTQRNDSVQNIPLIRDNRPVQSGCWLCFNRYSGLLRLVTAELLLFLLCIKIVYWNEDYPPHCFHLPHLNSTVFSYTTPISFLLFVVVAQLVLTVKVCLAITRELTRSKRSEAVKYTMKAFGWFLCQLLFMKCVQIISIFVTPSFFKTITNEWDPNTIIHYHTSSVYAFGTVMYLSSVLGVLGYLLVLHESLEYLGISRLVDFLITLSRLQAMPGLAKRRKEKIQHVMECFDYPNCVREFMAVQKGSRFSLANFTYPIRNPMLAISAILIFIIVSAYVSYIMSNDSLCNTTGLLCILVLFFVLNYSMVKNALQSFLLFFCIIPTSCI